MLTSVLPSTLTAMFSVLNIPCCSMLRLLEAPLATKVIDSPARTCCSFPSSAATLCRQPASAGLNSTMMLLMPDNRASP